MTSEILEPALSEALNTADDPDAYWAAVQAVQQKEPALVWAELAPLATSDDPVLRTLVPDVLRFLGGKAQPLREQTIELFRKMLASEADVGVLNAIALAFADIHHPAVVEFLVPLTRHEDPDLRRSAVQGLFQAVEPVMDRFIELTKDTDGEVRNWAVFGLAALVEVRPQHVGALREVFAASINDPNAEAKAEAVLGLARCLDRRALEPVRIGLNSGFDQYNEAAQLLIDKGIGVDVLRRALSKI